MAEAKFLERITVDPAIFGGKPIIRGMRLSVELILSLLAQGETWEELRRDYPDLEPEDIQACLIYARRHVGHERIEPLTIETSTRQPGSAIGEVTIIEDDDTHLDDFKEYIP